VGQFEELENSAAAEAWFAPGLFSQKVPKPLGPVGVSLWNPLRSGPTPLLRLDHASGLQTDSRLENRPVSGHDRALAEATNPLSEGRSWSNYRV
jgi:hypothetical protein